MTHESRRFRLRPLDERGATAIEYALMASLLAVGAIAAVMSFGGGVSALYTGWVGDYVAAVPAASP